MTNPELYAALAAAARTPRLLVGSDFDGVLAPFSVDPMAARALPGSIESLVTLAALPNTWAAAVSGRDLATLTTLTGLADGPVTRIGSHGAETSSAGLDDLDDDSTGLLARLEADLTEVADAHPGVGVEVKPRARVLHTRGASAADAVAAEAAALEVGRRHTGVHVMEGKHIVELAVVKADKGSALRALGAEVGADALVYFGDDRTDEDVFTVLTHADVGVKVGEGATAAAYRVAAPEDVRDTLAEIVRLRSAV